MACDREQCTHARFLQRALSLAVFLAQGLKSRIEIEVEDDSSRKESEVKKERDGCGRGGVEGGCPDQTLRLGSILSGLFKK